MWAANKSGRKADKTPFWGPGRKPAIIQDAAWSGRMKKNEKVKKLLHQFGICGILKARAIWVQGCGGQPPQVKKLLRSGRLSLKWWGIAMQREIAKIDCFSSADSSKASTASGGPTLNMTVILPRSPGTSHWFFTPSFSSFSDAPGTYGSNPYGRAGRRVIGGFTANLIKAIRSRPHRLPCTLDSSSGMDFPAGAVRGFAAATLPGDQGATPATRARGSSA